MIRCPARHRRRSNTHLQLRAFDLADRVPVRSGFAQNVKYQRFTIPGTERIHFKFFVRHFDIFGDVVSFYASLDIK